MYYLTMTSSFRGTNRLTGTLKGFERNLTKYSQIFLSPPIACCMGGETQGLLGSFPILYNTSHHCGSISFFFFFFLMQGYLIHYWLPFILTSHYLCSHISRFPDIRKRDLMRVSFKKKKTFIFVVAIAIIH